MNIIDRAMVAAAHAIGHVAFSVTRLFVYAQFLALVGAFGIGLILAAMIIIGPLLRAA